MPTTRRRRRRRIPGSGDSQLYGTPHDIVSRTVNVNSRRISAPRILSLVSSLKEYRIARPDSLSAALISRSSTYKFQRTNATFPWVRNARSRARRVSLPSFVRRRRRFLRRSVRDIPIADRERRKKNKNKEPLEMNPPRPLILLPNRAPKTIYPLFPPSSY